MPPPGLGGGGATDWATTLGLKILQSQIREWRAGWRDSQRATWSQSENPRPWFPAAKSAGGTADYSVCCTSAVEIYLPTSVIMFVAKEWWVPKEFCDPELVFICWIQLPRVFISIHLLTTHMCIHINTKLKVLLLRFQEYIKRKSTCPRHPASQQQIYD